MPPTAVPDIYTTPKNTQLVVGTPPTENNTNVEMNFANFVFRKRAAGPPLGALGQSGAVKGLVRAFDFEISETAMEPYVQAPSGQPKAGPWSTGIYSHGGVTNVNWRKDPAIRSHGTGSLLMRTPALGGTDAAGHFQIPFLDDFLNATQREALYAGEGEILHFQYRMRVNAGMLVPYAGAASPAQWKVSIMGQGNRVQGPPLYGDTNDIGGLAGSCTPIEIVHQTRRYNVVAQNPGPAPYHSCGSSPYGGAGFHGFGQTDFSGTLVEQNAIGTDTGSRCVYPNFSANCFSFLANVWYTIRFRVDIGNWGQPNSRIRMWATPDGGATILIADSQIFVDNDTADAGYRLATPDANYKWGKLWFLPYISGRDSGVTHPGGDGHLWIDEVLISKGPKDLYDPPRDSYPLVAAIKGMSSGQLRELTAGGDPIGPGSGYTSDFFSVVGSGGVLAAWSSKMVWDPVNKVARFCGTGHNPSANTMYHVQYHVPTHAWTKTPFTHTSWTHGYASNATSWDDGKHYWDIVDGDVRIGHVWNDPVGSPAVFTQLPNMPGGTNQGHLGNPQEWFPTIRRLARWDGWNGLYTFNPETSAWQQHVTAATHPDLNQFNNYQWMCYHQIADCILFGGGASSNKILRFNFDGTVSQVGQTANPFSSIPEGTACNVIASPIANELIIFDGRTDQVHVLNLTTNTWSRRTSLEPFMATFGVIRVGAPGGTGDPSACWGQLACVLYEYGAVLFAKGSVSARRMWIWKL